MSECPLCRRPLRKVVSSHHLIPKSFKGKKQVKLHLICHDKIHSVFTERELANYYHTIPRILENEAMMRFVSWVSKKDPDFFETTKDAADRKKKRR